jgi:hypothetical protein
MKHRFASYEPIKVTYKKKVNLRDLTPDTDDPRTTIFLIVGATIGFWAPVIILVAWYVISLFI